MKRQKNGVWKLTDDDMNFISLLASEAAARYENINLNALSKNANKLSKEIFNILDNAGYYKGV